MRILYFHAQDGNFGDDLNKSIWQRVLHPDIWNVPDIVVVGIGTILNGDRLNAETVPERHVYALGSGAGYGPLPDRLFLERMNILAVRGPLSALALGIDQGIAATDGAALLSTIEGGRSTAGANDVLFIPHISSAVSGLWELACSEAGVKYLDPRSTVEEVLAAIGGANLVITEAMHGAILSDTMRVPWVPAASSRKILDFKWQDWTRSLGLAYQPHMLPPTRTREGLAALRRAAPTIEPAGSNQELVEVYKRSVGAKKTARRKSGRRFRQIDPLLSKFDRVFARHAGKALAKLRDAPPQLSDENAFNLKVEQLQNAVRKLERDVLDIS